MLCFGLFFQQKQSESMSESSKKGHWVSSLESESALMVLPGCMLQNKSRLPFGRYISYF
jgi:hypothetical protein